MKVAILGAAGEIAILLRDRLLEETDYDMVLFARDADKRLKVKDSARETIVSGDFNQEEILADALKNVDMVYLNDINDPWATQHVINATKKANVDTLIAASMLDVYDEVSGKFGEWNKQILGPEVINRQKIAAAVIENSDLNTVLLRFTWLYNEEGNERYELTDRGEIFTGTQVTRQACVRFIMNILENPNEYVNRSIGVQEPDTDWDKPSFY